jgi:phosphate starvation-inducible protein PhoH and related proteins
MSKKRKLEDNFILDENEINNSNKAKINSIIYHEIKVIAKNDSQKELIKSIKDNQITICSGKAGTGKTFVSLAYALSLLRSKNNKYQKIYLVKSVTTLKGEEIGFLKGNLQEKFEPFIWSYLINMEKIVEDMSIRQLLDSDIIRPFPLAYARGTTLDNAIIIADEMQNVSLDNARTLITRIGKESKLILLGDTNQVDLRNKDESSLEPFLTLFKDIPSIGLIRMSDKDTNVRNPLIDIIEERFKEYYANGKK